MQKLPNKQYASTPPLSSKKEKDRTWHWSYTIALTGLFGGLFSLAFAGSKTLITAYDLSRVVCIACVAGFIIPFRYYKKWWGMNKLETFLFNIMGAGPVLVSVLLWINFFIGKNTYEEKHEIIVAEYTRSFLADGAEILFTLNNNAFEKFPEARRFAITPEEKNIAAAQFINYEIRNGVLGYKVIVKKETSNE
jgi:hypothetical protein